MSSIESAKLAQVNFKKNLSTTNDEIDSYMLIQNKNSSVKIWLADLTHTNSRIISNHMPYGTACVAAFTEKYVNLNNPIRLFKYPQKLSEAPENDGIPDIIGFRAMTFYKNLNGDK